MHRIAQDLQPLATPIEGLRLDPRNARRHPEVNMAAIQASLERFGQRKPAVANRRTGIVLAGNGLVTAARALGWDQVAVVWTDDDETTATAYGIADNRTADLSMFDDAVLADLLREVEDEYPPADLGFTLDEVEALVRRVEAETGTGGGGGGQPAPEPVEPSPAPVSRPGEVYQLGPHRVICGDSRDFTTWAALLGDERAALIFTSPPYAARRDYDETSGFQPIKADEYVDWWEPLQACAAHYLAADGSFMVNIKEHAEHGTRHLYTRDLVLAHVRRWGWLFVEEFCWERNGIPGSPQIMRRFKNQWEPVFHFARAADFKFRPESVTHISANAVLASPLNPKLKDLTEAGRSGDLLTGASFGEGQAYPGNRLPPFVSENVGHTAAFPVGLPEFFARAFTDRGDLVVDPFMGSGSTLIAAARTERRCYGLEISPGYVDVIRRRWGDYCRALGGEPGPDAL
ncbi:MAG: DNA modification methylase [Planctomycetes bacterium]|nr:DNA modification methylase [Planctomycetota bacterium]